MLPGRSVHGHWGYSGSYSQYIYTTQSRLAWPCYIRFYLGAFVTPQTRIPVPSVGIQDLCPFVNNTDEVNDDRYSVREDIVVHDGVGVSIGSKRNIQQACHKVNTKSDAVDPTVCRPKPKRVKRGTTTVSTVTDPTADTLHANDESVP